MEFNLRSEGDLVVIELPERVDANNTQELMDLVRGAMGKGTEVFILDGTRTAVLDSTALGGLVSLLRTLKTSSGKIALVGLQDSVRRVLALAHLESVFALYPTVDAALTALQVAC